MQRLEICLPSDLSTTEAYFSFQLTFTIVVSFSYHHKMEYNCCQVSISFLNCLMFRFSSKKVSKRDSSMAAFVTVHAGSFCGLQEVSFNISHFYLFVFLHCRHKMKYSCYQDSSVIRSWFVYLVWIEEDFAAGFKSNLQASEYRKRLGPHLLGFRS